MLDFQQDIPSGPSDSLTGSMNQLVWTEEQQELLFL